jgi:transcriptional regulator with XRE-family HTH domain
MVTREIAFRKCAFTLQIARAEHDVPKGRQKRPDERYGTKVAGGTSPTVRRRELGFLLRKLRTDRGLSVEEVTARLLFSATKVSRLETGRAGASARDIRDLCDLYEVTDPAERERLMTLAREGKQRAWWQEYALPYATYVGLEAEAASISDYNSDVVTGVLQTEDYARSILEVAEPPLDQATIGQRIESRLKRRALLTRDDGPVFHFILDEGALHRPVGGAGVMRAQLGRIIEIAGLPKVTFQLIPLDLGAHPALDSTFVILAFSEPMVNDVVYVEGFAGNIYLESQGDLERYRQMFSRLQSIALRPADSIELLRRITTKYA